MKKCYYDYKVLQDFIAKLTNEHRYNCIHTWEGSLGIGNWICCPPDDKHYFFIIHEEYANEWSSHHWMMKCRKLPKKWKEEYIKWEENNEKTL